MDYIRSNNAAEANISGLDLQYRRWAIRKFGDKLSEEISRLEDDIKSGYRHPGQSTWDEFQAWLAAWKNIRHEILSFDTVDVSTKKLGMIMGSSIQNALNRAWDTQKAGEAAEARIAAENAAEEEEDRLLGLSDD